MTAIAHLNNNELIFFEKAFCMILVIEQRNRNAEFLASENSFEELKNLAANVYEFSYVYKEFFNKNAKTFDEYELRRNKISFSNSSPVKLKAILVDEYEKLKNVLEEYSEENDEHSKNFLIVAEDVFNYTSHLIQQTLFAKRDHTEKFKNWIRLLTDGMM